jgi:hypothetical protein
MKISYTRNQPYMCAYYANNVIEGHYVRGVCAVAARDDTIAEIKALAHARKRFPLHEGYTRHTVVVNVFPLQEMLDDGLIELNVEL